MKRTFGPRPICLCTVLIFSVGLLLCAARTSPEEAPVAVEPGPPPEVNVWVEAIFVELDRAATRDFEEKLGFKLSPPDGKAFLSAEDKEKILGTVAETENARIIASVAVLTIPGQQTQTGHVEELTYATEFKYQEGKIVPGNWQTRDFGAILNLTPTIYDDGRIALILMPEVTTLSGWKEIDGTEVTQPIFSDWNATTTVIVPDGSTFVLKGAPVAPFFRSQAIDPEAATDPANQKTLLTIISTKVVETK
jgi:hypothetical protein